MCKRNALKCRAITVDQPRASLAIWSSLGVLLLAMFTTTAPGAIIMTAGNGGTGPVYATAGSTVDVGISAADLAGVTSIQFTLSWDAGVLEYVSGTVVDTDFNGTGFNEHSAGKLSVLWEDPTTLGQNSANGPIYTIRFNTIGAIGATSSLDFTDDPPTPRAIYDTDINLISGVQWLSGSVEVVPEPINYALATFGLGALGYGALRRWQQNRTEKTAPRS